MNRGAGSGGELRWRFPHPSEDNERQRVLDLIDAFWRAFAASADRLATQVLGDIAVPAAFMREHLSPIEPLLAWEIGPEAGDGAHVLTVTAEAHHRLQPLVDVVLSRAPVLPGWRLTPFRLARPLPMVQAAVEGRVGVELTDKWTARAWKGPCNTVAVLVSPPGGLFRSTAKDREVAEVALEALLGEELFHGWVGNVEVARRGGTSPLAELPDAIARLVAETDAALAARPREPAVGADGKIHGNVMELQAPAAEDYAAQDDLRVGSTFDTELWRAQHQAPSFRDRRFSRTGEVHCYLKVDGTQVAKEMDRSDLEDAILAAAEGAGLALRMPGGGTGLRYAYIDLVLGDVARAVEVLRPALRNLGVPRRSWILFWDDCLVSEWIPIWDDAPPPPRTTE